MSLTKNPTADFPVRNIILAGFMGTGKSTVGRALAGRLGWTFVDTDSVIEARAGKTIAQIFAEDGEPAFRALEAELAREAAAWTHRVIATGGGMVVPETNLRTLERAGAVVLLSASSEQILARVASETHRPLLAKPDPRGEIERLLAGRAQAYGRVAIAIDTNHKEPAMIADEILQKVGARCLGAGIPAPARVRVELGDRSYDIRIGQGWLETLGETIAPVFTPRPVVLVTNPTIRRLWAEPVLASLERAGFSVSVCEIPEGERHKTLASVALIYDHMLGARHSRQSGIIALGGGVVGDIAGFAAATLLRGIAYLQLPTTLLAMVDSSVGGKTGVDHAMGKNLIGAFWQPTFVGIELRFLETLPIEELRAGMAEVIKYGVIADAALFADLEEHVEAALARDPAVLTRLIRRSCEIKAEVVSGDERDEGRRAMLNFGHTLGHAAESLSQYAALRHGEAVAMGMLAAARLARGRGLIDEAVAARLEQLLRRAGLPTRMLPFSLDEYWAAMASDKKVKDGQLGFVLPERLGQVGIYRDVTREEIARCLEVS